MLVSGWTLYALLAVVAVTVLSFAVGVLRAVLKKGSIWDNGTTFLSNILHYVAPLLVLAYLIPLDPTGIILLIVYFAAALCAVIKLLMDMT